MKMPLQGMRTWRPSFMTENLWCEYLAWDRQTMLKETISDCCVLEQMKIPWLERFQVTCWASGQRDLGSAHKYYAESQHKGQSREELDA